MAIYDIVEKSLINKDTESRSRYHISGDANSRHLVFILPEKNHKLRAAGSKSGQMYTVAFTKVNAPPCYIKSLYIDMLLYIWNWGHFQLYQTSRTIDTWPMTSLN